MADDPEFDRREQAQAIKMSANMPASIQAEVMKHPTGSVARLLVENGGSAAAFYEDAAKLSGIPFDIQQLAKQQMAAIGATNEAANRHDARLASGLIADEMFAEAAKRNSEASKTNAEEAHSAQETTAEKLKAEQERQMKSVEKLSGMSYDEWSHRTQDEKAKFREDVRGVQRQNEDKAAALSDGLEQEFLAQNGDTPETRKRWTAIRKGVLNTGADKQEAYRANLSPQDQSYFDRLDSVTGVLLSDTVVTAQRVGKPTAEQDHHDFDAVSSAAQSARNGAEVLRHEAERQSDSSPEIRKRAFENSDAAFMTIRSTPSADAASTADAAITENVAARKLVSDQISMTEFRAKARLGEQAMQDDYGDAPSVAGKPSSPAAAPVLDASAPHTPAGNTNDLSPLYRAQALMAEPNEGPESPRRRPPSPANRGPMG